MRVDATPPVRPSTRMNGLRQLLDSIEFFWGRWVVGYDLGRQLDLARHLERGVGGGRAGAAAARQSITWRRIGGVAGVMLGLAGLTWLAARRRRGVTAPGAHRHPALPHAVGRLYRKCLERLARRNLGRRPSETQREHARRVSQAGVEGAAAFAELTALYLEARFGRAAIDDARVAGLARRLTRLGEPVGPPSAGVRAA